MDSACYLTYTIIYRSVTVLLVLLCFQSVHFTNVFIMFSMKALRLGDTCTKQEDCSLVNHSQCDIAKGVCTCTEENPVDGGTLCGQGTYSGQGNLFLFMGSVREPAAISAPIGNDCKYLNEIAGKSYDFQLIPRVL